MNLIKKLGLTLALTSTITLSACSIENSVEYQDLTAELSTDISSPLVDIVAVIPETGTSGHYISCIGHYDEGYDGGMIPHHLNHKDYRITYKISRDEYFQISKMYNNNTIKWVSGLSKDELKYISKLIKDYDPVECVELDPEGDSHYENQQGNLLVPNEYRFDEEKYLESLNEKKN